MDSVVVIAIVALHLINVSLLAVFGLNAMYLTWKATRLRQPQRPPPLQKPWPKVTIQLPIYNEYWVAERVIDAAARLDWPRDLLEIQVLDDSTDNTYDISAQAVRRWQAAGINIVHIHRTQRQGYKAGALQAGLRQARGEFIAIFDADFVPAPDFLYRTLGVFCDPQIAYVQTRWGHLNRDASWLTYLQSLYIDGHFMVEQLTRAGQKYVMSFNGTGGVWRRAAIEDAGGWSSYSLTEDLDLSYRAALRGWRSAYLWDTEVPGELVSSLSAYRRQQARWAQGSAQCARRLLPTVLRSSFPLSAKLQAVLHLLGYSIPVLMLCTSLLYPFLLMIPFPDTARTLFFWSGLVMTPLMLGPWLLLVSSQRILRPRHWWPQIPGILALCFLSSGLALNTTRAFWRGLRAQPGAFERTPKIGSSALPARARQLYTRPQRDRIVLAELALAGVNFGSALLALRVQSAGIFINALIFATGLLLIACATIKETRVSPPPVRQRKVVAVRQPDSQAESALPIVSTFDRTR